MDYTDINAVEAYILQDISPDFEPKVAVWITAMSRYMDEVTKRTLCLIPTEEHAELQTFSYDGDRSDLILVSDCHSIEEVTVEGAVVDLDTIAKYPSNKPYTSRMAFKDGSKWPCGRQNVTVKAIHAMSGADGIVPADIKFACTVLVGGICNNQINQGEGTTERIGNYTITYDKSQEADVARAKDILSTYTRIAIG